MAGLKIIRNIVGLPWIAVFIWGIVSLFRGDWAGFGIAAVLWVLLGILFGSVHSALQRAEVDATSAHMSEVAVAVSLGNWGNALESSARSVRILQAGVTRDGGQKELAGPFAVTLVSHAILLGAVGRQQEANDALDRAIPALQKFRRVAPQVSPLLDIAAHLRNSYPSTFDYQQAARALHAFV